MWDSAWIALGKFLDPLHLAYLLFGVAEGIFVGLLPGMGGVASVAILLPFIYGLNPTPPWLSWSGPWRWSTPPNTITAVLIGVPSSSASATTVLDGHPMAMQGQAARALSAAFLSSLIGGFIGVLALTLSIPIARPLVLSFGSPELFVLCLMGSVSQPSFQGMPRSRGLHQRRSACLSERSEWLRAWPTTASPSTRFT